MAEAWTMLGGMGADEVYKVTLVKEDDAVEKEKQPEEREQIWKNQKTRQSIQPTAQRVSSAPFGASIIRFRRTSKPMC